jgi:SagB-type dehydrogenase family enzyme
LNDNLTNKDHIISNRAFMKSCKHLLADIKTDQQLGLPQPDIQKEYDPNAQIIKLPEMNQNTLLKRDILECFNDRRSLRKYTNQDLTLSELSFLLWATQGVQRVMDNNCATFRTVPSSGARHPYETYLIIRKVETLKEGIYRYIPLNHELIFLHAVENIDESLTNACLGQRFIAQSNVSFIWSNIPRRGEWKYNITSHKAMLIDVGHICQNLYLASEAINCGACGIASYDQKLMDQMIGVDGEDEYTVYLSPVGKK